MDHQRLKELVAMAALERLEPDEKLALGAHLANGCSECDAELLSFKDSLAALTIAAADESPDGRIWSRLERRLRESRDGREADVYGPVDSGKAASGNIRSGATTRPEALPQRSARHRFWMGVAGAATAAAVAMAMLTYEQSAQMRSGTSLFRHQIATLSGQVANLTADLTAAESQVALLNGELDNRVRLTHILLAPEGLRVEIEASTFLTRVMLAPDARVIQMQSTPHAAGAGGMVTLSTRAGTAILEAAGLPPNPPDSAYELWWIVARRTPVRAAVFRAERGRDAIILASLPPGGVRLMAGAVTLERAGGSNLPSGQIYLKGEVLP
jgi:anti-sigma-K factor RskA